MTGRVLRWAWALARSGSRHDGAAPECVLTVVRHHRVYGDGEDPLYRLGVNERLFAEQLHWLSRQGRVVTMRQGLERLEAREPGAWVAITFDDGYRDNVTRALPLLERAGMRATFYLTAGAIEERATLWWDELAWALERTSRSSFEWRGRKLGCAGREEKRRTLQRLLPAFRAPRQERLAALRELRHRLGVSALEGCDLMDWEEARTLARAGMELGAHSLSHPALSLLGRDEQRHEAEGSRRLIEERAQVTVDSFAYPGGDFSELTLQVVRDAGFRSAVTTMSGSNAAGFDPFRLRRRSLSEGACLDPAGRFSAVLARAELEGAFDGWRGRAWSGA